MTRIARILAGLVSRVPAWVPVALVLITVAASTFAAGYLAAPRATVRVAVPVPSVCAFDGGGIAPAGSLTVTDTGTWLCTDDGRLTRVRPVGKSGTVRHAASPAAIHIVTRSPITRH